MSLEPKYTLWQRAAAFAAQTHVNQCRHDGATPYFSHPVRVALTVATTFEILDETILAAALLHDVIEDSTVDYDELAEQFNPAVAELVSVLSKDARLPEAAREEAYDRGLADGPWEARLIKLADVYDNLLDRCDDARLRQRMLIKARRAINLAHADPQLQQPQRIVSELVEQFEK